MAMRKKVGQVSFELFSVLLGLNQPGLFIFLVHVRLSSIFSIFVEIIKSAAIATLGLPF